MAEVPYDFYPLSPSQSGSVGLNNTVPLLGEGIIPIIYRIDLITVTLRLTPPDPFGLAAIYLGNPSGDDPDAATVIIGVSSDADFDSGLPGFATNVRMQTQYTQVPFYIFDYGDPDLPVTSLYLDVRGSDLGGGSAAFGTVFLSKATAYPG